MVSIRWIGLPRLAPRVSGFSLPAIGCLALASTLDEVAFGPEPETVLERTWSERLSLEIDSLDETMGGNPVNLPFSRIEFEGARSFQVADEVTRSEGGRPVDLTRRFGGATMELAIRLDDEPVGRVEGGAACEEAEVRFVFDEEEEAYLRERIEGDLEGDALDALEPDLDLVALLPEGELEPGDSWSLEPEALRAFFAAGGDIGFRARELTIEMEGAPVGILLAGALGSLHQVFGPEGEISGEAEASFEGMEEDESGSPLARFEYELALESKADFGERYRSFFSGDVSADSHDLRLAAELEGRLVLFWDLGGRHLRSASFEGDLLLTGHLVFPVRLSEEQEPVEFVGDYELGGEVVVELLVE